MSKSATIHDRIKLLVDKYGEGKNTVFATLIGSNEGSIRGYIKGVTPKQDVLEGIVRNLDVNPGWLLTGEGSMFQGSVMLNTRITEPNEEPAKENENSVSEPEISIYKLKTDYFGVEKQLIPLYELEASAGLNTLFANQNTQIPLDYISVPNAPKCDGALYIRGDSMYPVLKAGDIVCFKIIKEFQDVRPGEMYVLDIEDNSDRYLTVKYIQRSDISDEYFKLVSQNINHQSKEEHKSHIKALAIVKVSIRYNTIS